MATDGVKIIDGDLAHDVYYTFMDPYDAGESIETIKTTVEQLRIDNDDIDDEIFGGGLINGESIILLHGIYATRLRPVWQ